MPSAALQTARPALAADPAPEPGFGLYVHWPFCLSKCPYCDFNSHVREGVDQRRWRAALLAELDHFAALAPGRTLTSIFFGGGTPSLMEPETAARVIERARDHWEASPALEITLEANPSSSEVSRFRDYREAGVNRLSLGVQALDDSALRFLGRAHAAAEALRAIEAAAAIYPRYSFDLIYARPGQSVASWRAELARALAFAGDHLSLYQLTIEEGTAFHARASRGEIEVPADSRAAALLDATWETMARAGLPAYEVSNHARRGAECRHNLTYWRGGEYVGIGPGAHGRLALPRPGAPGATRAALRQIRAPESWLEAVERSGHATAETHTLTAAERIAEALMMGLRLRDGISAADFRRATGLELDEALDPSRLAPLIEGGFMAHDAGGLRATPAGLRRLNAVLAAVLP